MFSILWTESIFSIMYCLGEVHNSIFSIALRFNPNYTFVNRIKGNKSMTHLIFRPIHMNLDCNESRWSGIPDQGVGELNAVKIQEIISQFICLIFSQKVINILTGFCVDNPWNNYRGRYREIYRFEGNTEQANQKNNLFHRSFLSVIIYDFTLRKVAI